MKNTKVIATNRDSFVVGPTQKLEDKIQEIKTKYENLNPGLIVEMEVSEGQDQAMNPGTFIYQFTVKLLRELD